MAALPGVARILAYIVLGLAGILLVGLLLLQTSWARSNLRQIAEARAEAALGAEVSIGVLGGTLLSDATLRDVAISHDARPILTAPLVEVDYSLLDLLTGDLDLASVSLRDAVIHIWRAEEGALNVAALGAAGHAPEPTGGEAVSPRGEGLAGTDTAVPVSRASGRGWSIDEIAIRNGTVVIGDDVVTADALNAPERLINLDADLSIRSRPEGGILLGIDALGFQTVAPAIQVAAAKGEVVIASRTLAFDALAVRTSFGTITIQGAIRNRQATPVYDVQFTARDLRLPEVANVVPALEGYTLTPTIEASLQGPQNQLQTRFDVQTQAGNVSGDVVLDPTAPRREVRGTIRTRNLNLAALNLDREKTDITLTANVDLTIPESGLEGLSGTYDLTAPQIHYAEYDARSVNASGRIAGREIQVDAQARIYGGTLQTQGTITLPSGEQPIRYDLEGKLRGVDPKQLPEKLAPSGAERRIQEPPLVHPSEHAPPVPLHVRASLPSVGFPSSRNDVVRASLTASGVSGVSGDSAVPRRGVAARVTAQAAGGQGIDLDFRIKGRGAEVQAEARLLDFSLGGADFGKDTVVNVSREGGRLQYSAAGTVRGLNLRRLGLEMSFEGLTGERFDSRINARFDITGGGTELETLTLRGTATLTNSELFGARFSKLALIPNLTRGSGTVALDGLFEGLDLGAITGNPSLESQLQGSVDAKIALESVANPDFSIGAIEASGRLTLADSSVSGVTIEEAVVAASLSEAVARIRVLTVTGPDLQVEASGRMALDESGSSELTYLIDTPALQRLEELGISARGDVLLKGVVRGNLPSLQVEGTIAGTHVGYSGTSALSIKGNYNVAIPGLSPARASAAASIELSELETGGRSFDAAKADVDYSEGKLAFVTTLEDVERTIDADGFLVWHPDHQEVHLRRLGLQTPEATWTLAADDEAVIQYGGGRLAVQDLVLASGAGGRIAVDGTLGSADSILTAAIEGLRLDNVDDLILDEEPLSGIVSADAKVRGTFEDLQIDATAEVINGAFRGFEYQRAAGTIEYTGDLVRLDVQIAPGEAMAITAEGVVPLSETAGEALRLAVRTTPVDLALVQTFTDEVRDVSGIMEADVTVLGSLAAPILEGSLAVRKGEFFVLLAQSRYTGLDTEVIFEGGLAQIREFDLVDDEGNRLRIEGQLALHPGKPRDVNITIRSDSFEIADNRLAELNVDTDLRITGDLMRPVIQGRVGLRESLIRIDRILQLARGAYKVGPTAEADKGEAESTAFAPTLAVVVKIPETLVIRGTDLRSPTGTTVGLGNVNLTIGGELKITKKAGEDFLLGGELQTVRGTYEFQGRQFTIQRDGRIVFLRTPEINPRLDIRAQREISGVTATVRIGGVLDAPELELSSQPPLEDAEILSLVVFNQPLSLLGTGQQVSLAARATALAGGFLASQLTESLGNALDLDLLDVQTTTADGALAPVLTVGEQFGQLFVKLRQRFGPQAVSEAVIEYRIAEWLRLETSYAQGDATARNLLQRAEAGGLDLLFFFSY